MNRKHRALYLALGIPCALLIFIYLTILLIPNDVIKGALVRAAANSGFVLDCTGFGKAFPLGVKARALELSSDQGALLQVRDARVALKFLPLLAGRVRVDCTGRIGGGEVAADIALGKAPGWELQARGVRLEDIPFFATVAGARVKGELRVNGSLASAKGQQPSGDLQLEIRSAELAGAKIGAMPLPDATYRDVQGALRIEKGRALLKSFTLNGDGIYVRLKGDMPISSPIGNSPLNLTLEMMPKPEFLERQKFVFLLLTKYQTSPGAYSVPIHGTLAHPAI